MWRLTTRVLVVEDDEQLRDFMRLAFEDAGSVVRAVASGTEALEALSAEGETYDLVVLDLVLPRVNGLQVLAAVRQAPATRCLPVLITTGTLVFPQQFSGDEPIALLRKPFDQDGLIRAADTLMLGRQVR